jgi:hypothetical protein
VTDTDYIREGVKLADGFQLTNDERYFSMPHGGYVPTIDECPQQYIDALAAQLVRQVEYAEHIVAVTKEVTQIKHVRDNYSTHVHEPVARKSGPDRTLNTIKAIVDSGVLAEGPG